MIRAVSGSHDALRVLHVVESFGAGTMQVVRLIAGRLVEEGAAAAIAFGTQPETPRDVRAGLDPRIELHPTPWTSRGPAAQLHAVRALRRIAREFRPGVVHLHSSFAGAVGSAALGGRYRCIYTPHAYAFQQAQVPRAVRTVFQLTEMAIARRVALVGAVGQYEAALARSGARAPRVTAIVNGIPELDHPVTPVGDRPGRPAVIAAGRAGPQRQPAAIARILSAVSDVADVTWVGGASRSDGGRSALAEAGVPFTGWLRPDEVAERLRAATVYVHWSRWDGLSLGLLEALAYDVIVVASAIGPNEEVLGREQTFRHEHEAIDFLRRLLSDAALREQTRRRQRTLATRYGARRMTSEWLGTYRELAAR
jgi:glycosyltransferase involved in cell wall biosynthesis